MSTLTHGKWGTRLYWVWWNMICRCENSKTKQFRDYGGRGIKVCERWRNSFAAFLEDMGECPQGWTLDRKDNNGNYEPENCRWATRKEQQRNSRSVRMLEVQGVRGCFKDLLAHFHMVSGTVRHRIDHLGWSPERAFTEPADGWRHRRGR